MNRWSACVGLVGAIVLDLSRYLFRVVEPGLRAVGSCWCAGYAPPATRATPDERSRVWSRTREALIHWHAAAGLAEIDRLLEREPQPRERDLPSALRSPSNDRDDDRP